MSDKIEFITVKAAVEDGRVALYENHSANVTKDNPDGEAYVVGNGQAVKVAKTPTVEQKLRDGVLVEVGGFKQAEVAKKPAEANKKPE